MDIVLDRAMKIKVAMIVKFQILFNVDFWLDHGYLILKFAIISVFINLV